jgi:hypothetical protein
MVTKFEYTKEVIRSVNLRKVMTTMNIGLIMPKL